MDDHSSLSEPLPLPIELSTVLPVALPVTLLVVVPRVGASFIALFPLLSPSTVLTERMVSKPVVSSTMEVVEGGGGGRVEGVCSRPVVMLPSVGG